MEERKNGSEKCNWKRNFFFIHPSLFVMLYYCVLLFFGHNCPAAPTVGSIALLNDFESFK
jgi:hypothetical protein